jgi:tRNA 2-thiocytidine biosynthesis protein TtcA
MTKLHRTIRKQIEKAILDYCMIEKDDRILIAVSGGPDSLSLLKIFKDGFIHVVKNFSFIIVHIDLGFQQNEPKNWQILESHFKNLNIEYRIVHTQISKTALAHDAKKNPCFICSHYRRKHVYEIAHQEKCNKIAYGHHKDDIIETLLINILYGRKINTMNPVQEIFQGTKNIIRPLSYVDEKLLKKFAPESKLPALPRLCPMDGNTRRQIIKQMIAQLDDVEKHANIRENIFKSLFHLDVKFAPDLTGKNNLSY